MMLKKNKKFFIVKLYCNFITNVCWILIMGSVASTGGNTFGRNGKADRYSSKLFAVAGILSVFAGSAYFM